MARNCTNCGDIYCPLQHTYTFGKCETWVREEIPAEKKELEVGYYPCLFRLFYDVLRGRLQGAGFTLIKGRK